MIIMDVSTRRTADLEAGPQCPLTTPTINLRANDQPSFDCPSIALVQAVLCDDQHLASGYLSFDVLHKLVLLNHQTHPLPASRLHRQLKNLHLFADPRDRA
jgi:hypothetical protein